MNYGVASFESSLSTQISHSDYRQLNHIQLYTHLEEQALENSDHRVLKRPPGLEWVDSFQHKTGGDKLPAVVAYSKYILASLILE